MIAFLALIVISPGFHGHQSSLDLEDRVLGVQRRIDAITERFELSKGFNGPRESITKTQIDLIGVDVDAQKGLEEIGAWIHQSVLGGIRTPADRREKLMLWQLLLVQDNVLSRCAAAADVLQEVPGRSGYYAELYEATLHQIREGEGRLGTLGLEGAGGSYK